MRIPVACGLFFFSGLTGLVYELIWARRLTLIFGHSVLAVSTVLAVFMAGLGWGSRAGGWLADSGRLRTVGDFLRAYAWAEVGVALTGLLSMPLLQGVARIYPWLASHGWSGALLHLSSLGLFLIVLLPPTLLMGATLPILARGLASAEGEGRLVGALYGTNTAGACLGAALAGYLLLPTWGLQASVLGAAFLNLLLGLWAALWARSRPEPAAMQHGETSLHPGWALPQPVLVSLALAGASAMMLQVGWTRGMILAFGSSTYSFSAILTVYLAGLGLGSLLYAPGWLRPRASALAWVQLATAVLAGLASAAVGFLPYLVYLLLGQKPPEFLTVVTWQLGLSALLLLLPTTALGFAFPLSVEVYRVGGLGRRISTLYAANTAGCVVGALVAGFWLLPTWGSLRTLQAACLLLVLAAVVAGLNDQPERNRLLRLGFASMAGLAILALPPWNPAIMNAGFGIYPGQYKLLTLGALARVAPPFWFRDGMSSTVALYASSEGQLSMRVNGKVDASTNPEDLSTMYLTGYIPCLYRSPRSAAVIGLGGGMTLEALSAVPGVEQVDCAELERDVISAQEYWKGYNGRVADDPRVHIRELDGRTFLQLGSHRYDLIASEPSNVWMAGVGNLYTREFYELCRSRLTDGGVMAQWFQNYAVTSDEIGIVVRTFFSVFPHGAVWTTSVNEGDVLLVGSARPVSFDLAALERLASSERVRRHLFQIDLWKPEALLGHYLCERDRALANFSSGPENTDDRPVLEFRAARQTSARVRHESLGADLLNIGQPLPPGVPASPEILESASLGWMASRSPAELERLLTVFALVGRSPLVRALTTSASQGTSGALIRSFQPALAQTPLASYLLGRLLADRADWKAAETYLRVAAQHPPPGGRSVAWSQLARTCVRQGKLAEAEDALERAVDGGGGAASETLLGDVLMRSRQPRQALERFVRAIGQNQVYVPAWWGRAQALLELGHYRAAAAGYREVLALLPNHLPALMNLGYAYTRLLDFPTALASYQRVLDFYPDNRAARNSINQLFRTRPGVQFTPTE